MLIQIIGKLGITQV